MESLLDSLTTLQIQLQVFLDKNSTKPIFERILNRPVFDYQLFIDDMFQLFGKNCIIKMFVVQ